MLASYGAVLSIALFWALVIACASAAGCLRKRTDRKLSWHCALPPLSQLALAAFACTGLFSATRDDSIRSDGAVLTALVALIDLPLYAATWTSACGCHPVLSSALKPTGSAFVLSALLTAASVKLILLVLLTARPDIAAAWDDELGVDATAAAHGAFGAPALIAVSASAVALAAVVALAAANAWQGYTPHFRLVLALAFAGTCLVFLAPSFEAAAQAGLGLRCSLADQDPIAADGSNSNADGVTCSVAVLGCTILLPRLLAATIATAAVEYQAATALRAQDSIRDTLRLSLPGQQLAGAGVGSEQRGQGRRSTWAPQALSPARSTTVSVSNPITELELPVGAASAGGLGGGLALTPSLSTGESQRLRHHNHHHHHDAAGWGDRSGGYGGDSSRSMDSHDGGAGGFTPVLGMVVVEPESAAGSVPVTPVPSLPGTAGERSRFDSAGGVFDWGRRR